jgi:hypothetical protein
MRVGDVLFFLSPTEVLERALEPVAATPQTLNPKDFQRRDKIDFKSRPAQQFKASLELSLLGRVWLMRNALGTAQYTLHTPNLHSLCE